MGFRLAGGAPKSPGLRIPQVRPDGNSRHPVQIRVVGYDLGQPIQYVFGHFTYQDTLNLVVRFAAARLVVGCDPRFQPTADLGVGVKT